VTNFLSALKACDYYALRFTIETFFSDQKSRGFNIDKSYLSCPQRLTRLTPGTQIPEEPNFISVPGLPSCND
jgi:hypothetical protein